MKKEEFIKKLREKLDILDSKEIEDIIEEYTGYIEEKIQNGSSEEEAIKEFGDIDELATELLKAYKINVDKNKKDKNWMTEIVDTFSKWIDRIVKVFSNKSGSEILKIIIEILIILVALGLCKLPFYFLEEIGSSVFNVFQNAFGRSLYRIWEFIIEFAYLIFVIVLFAKIFEKRYMSEIEEEVIIPKFQETKEKGSNKANTETKIEKVIVEKQAKGGILNFLSTICIWFVKFIVFWILFGIGCYILGLGMCVGICLFLLARGVTYYGIYLSCLILMILGVLTFIPLFNFIANKRNNVKFLLISFLVSFVLLGISFSTASIEIASTEYINEIPTIYQKDIITKTIEMNEDYILIGLIDYEVDETLTSDIRIEFEYYPDFYNINPSLEYAKNNRIYFYWNTSSHHWNKKVLENIIADLKENRVYNYSFNPRITIYTSSENIEKLKQNKRAWNETKKYDEEKYKACIEELEYDGYDSLSAYCKSILNIQNEI